MPIPLPAHDSPRPLPLPIPSPCSYGPLPPLPLQSEKASDKQAAELSQWDKLHWVRTGLSLASLAVMVATVAGAARKA